MFLKTKIPFDDDTKLIISDYSRDVVPKAPDTKCLEE